MQTTTKTDQFALINQAKAERSAAEAAAKQAEEAARLEAEKPLIAGLDRILRLLGILTDADAPLKSNGYLVDQFVFSLTQGIVPYIFLEIEHLLTEEQGDALVHLLYRDDEHLSNAINTDKLIDYDVSADKLIDYDVSADKLIDYDVSADKLIDYDVSADTIQQFRLDVAERLHNLRFDYKRLVEKMAASAAKIERPPVVVLEYLFMVDRDRREFEGAASKLIADGYKLTGYAAGQSQSSYYGVVSAIFVLSED